MSDDERQIRMAAEAILSGSINSQRSSVTHSITRTPDIVVSEDLIAGARHNGRMSHVRRSFCLFVTFDLLLTSLMWLICTMIAGQSLKTAFIDQVVHYHIKTSLFDIVMAAICRFTVLLLFYALLYINHWIIIAISTAATCGFLIAKVFAFDWLSTNQPVFQVLLIIISFVLAWAEAWFFDFRVIPQEMQARNWFQNRPATERSPLIQGVSEARQHSNADHMSTFFTPMDSDNSDNDEEYSRKQGDTSLSIPNEVLMSIEALTPYEVEEHKSKASKLLQSCHDLLMSKEWKVECTTSEGDVLSYMQLPKPDGRIVKITGVVDAPASTLVDWLFEGIEEHPAWNKLVMESVKLQNIDENTDIVYQSTSPQGGGLITARDFIILRHRQKCGNFYISGGVSIPATTIPNRRHMIRGENGVGCWAAEELSDENGNQCRFTWILNTNLKGWIPQKVVDRSLSTALIDFMTFLRKHLEESEK